MTKKISVFMAIIMLFVTVLGTSVSAFGAAETGEAGTAEENIASYASLSTDAVPFDGWDGDPDNGGDMQTITDGIPDNEWYVDGNTPMPYHLDFQFEEDAVINGVTLSTANAADYMITGIRFQYLDGDQWVDLADETYETDPAVDQWAVRSKRTDFGQPVTTDTLRLEITGKAAWGAACRIGEIEIWGEYDGEASTPVQPEEPDEELSNLALKAETEIVNAVTTTGEGKEAINDNNTGTYFSILDSAPGDAVQEVTYDVQPEILMHYPATAEFSQMEWHSHGSFDGASVLEFQVSYYDAESDSFLPVTHSGGQDIFVPALMGKMVYTFDTPFETDQIKITLVKSRASWSKSGMLAEIKTLGVWTGDMPPETVEKETADKLAATDFETDENVNLLTDGDRETPWSATVYRDKYLRLHSDDMREIDKIVLYADEPQEDLGTIQVQTNTGSSTDFAIACEARLGEWVQEGNCYRAEINLKEQSFIDRNVKLVFSETHEISLTEVEWVGKSYDKLENVLRNVPLSNGSLIADTAGIVDGFTPSFLELDFDEAITADFEGYTADMDGILYVSRDENGISRYEKVAVGDTGIDGVYELPVPEEWNGKRAVSEIYISGTRSGEGAVSDGLTENRITSLDDGSVKIEFAEDKHSLIKNPATGWVLYIEDCYANPYAPDGIEITQGMTAEEYWEEIDRLMEQDLKPSILYIRLGWSWFEPEEGQYAWEDPDSDISRLIQGAKDRDLQLAFRVLIDSTDNSQQAIPEWVFDKGLQADNYTSVSNMETGKSLQVKDAKCDDPIFLEYFEKFLKAFGERFDTDSSVAYIDAQGMGDWGEVNRVCASDGETAVRRIMDLYRKYFKHVLLGFQIYSECGSDYGISEGFVMRRDGLGSPVWYGTDHKEGIVNEFLNGNVLYGESCYHGLEHSAGDGGRWSQTNNIVGWSTQQILQYLMDDALYSRANTLDLRMYSDALCWVEDYPEGIQRFVEEGGYRLSPVEMTVASKAEAGDTITIGHSWKNAGAGRLPNRNFQWKNKYVLNFALLDENNQVVKQIAVEEANPGDWIRESENIYETEFAIPENLENGKYKIAASILNQTEVGSSSINLALADTEKNGDWYILSDITIGSEVDSGDTTVPGGGDSDMTDPGDGGNSDVTVPGGAADTDTPNPPDESSDASASGSVGNTPQNTAAKTGDSSHVALWLLLAGAALAAGGIVLRRKKSDV